MDATRVRRLSGIAKVVLIIPVFGQIGLRVKPADRQAAESGEAGMAVFIKVGSGGRPDGLFRRFFQRFCQRVLRPELFRFGGTTPFENLGNRALRNPCGVLLFQVICHR